MDLTNMPRGYRLQVIRYLPRIDQELIITTIYAAAYRGWVSLVSERSQTITIETEAGPVYLFFRNIATIDIVISDWTPEKIQAARKKEG